MWRKIFQYYFSILSIFYLFCTVKCDLNEEVRHTVRQLKESSLKLYGEPKPRPVKLWELDAEDTVFYPNGDKQKLAAIAQLWSNYYQCTSRMVDGLTSSGHLPNINIVAYQGAVARLPCALCVAPGEESYVRWFYAKSKHNLTFNRLDIKTTTVCHINLTIYNTEEQDAGIYRCQIGGSVSGMVVLDVLDDDDYDVINGEPNSLKQPPLLKTSQNLVVFTSWSPWSECSRCNHVGVRKRFGMCYVRLDTNSESTKIANFSRITKSLLQEFPSGIACQSQILPQSLRNSINTRKNIIMTEPCQVPCKEIFEIRSKTGELIERANNTSGIYSLNQKLPPEPPPPSRDVIFVESGERLTLKCPGTTLRDIPITWRIGTRYINADSFSKGGRIYLNPRDFIVFSSVEYGDINVYSCWQSLNLAGVVKLQVWKDARFVNGRLIVAISLVIVALTIRFTLRLLRAKINQAP